MFDEILAPLLTTEWGRRSGWGAMICMGVLLFVVFIQTLSMWRSDLLLANHKQGSNKLVSTDEVAKLIAEIPDQHIFGKFGSLDGNVPITSLQLRLVGIVKAVPEKDSRVIISESNQPGKVYQIGDVLPSGVRVYAIASDGVILENGGRLEKLPLQRPPLLFQGKPKALLPEQVKGD